MRIGHGYDAHRFETDKPLVLGGVNIPYELGLKAHSDGDVVLHAVCDALLGAMAFGDIGKHFPDTDNQYKNADSRHLLRQVFVLCEAKGYAVQNLDVTIIAQAPKLAPYVVSMRKCIADDVQTDIENINVKATTTEGMGFAGRKEGIEVHAVVLMMPSTDA